MRLNLLSRPLDVVETQNGARNLSGLRTTDIGNGYCFLSGGRPMSAAAPPPAAPPAKKGMSTLLIVLIVVAGLCVVGGGILAAIMFPVFAQAKLAAQKSTTMSNMKQIAIASMMYQTDHDDLYPHRFSTHSDMSELLLPYIKESSYFETLNPSGGEIIPNDMFEGFNGVEVADVFGTVMIHETEDWPSGGRTFAFADSHVKFVRAEEIPSLNFDPFADPYGIFAEDEE